MEKIKHKQDNKIIAHFIYEYEKQQIQSESDFCDVTLVCDDGDIGTLKSMISSCFGWSWVQWNFFCF